MKDNKKLQVPRGSAKHPLNRSTGSAQSEQLNSTGLSWHTHRCSGMPALLFPNSRSHQGEISSFRTSKPLSSPDTDPCVQN